MRNNHFRFHPATEQASVSVTNKLHGPIYKWQRWKTVCEQTFAWRLRGVELHEYVSSNPSPPFAKHWHIDKELLRYAITRASANCP